MPTFFLLLGLALQDDSRTLEKQARDQAQELRKECAAALESVDGVGSIGLGGTGLDYRIVIAVRDAATQRRVRDLIGDSYGSVRIFWSIAEAPRRIPPPQPPAEGPPPAFPEAAGDRVNPGNPSPLDCDIIRDHLKLKPLTHPAANGQPWGACHLIWRSTVGPAGVTTFAYPDHRPDCPIRMGRVGEPAGADNFISWLFHQGITPPSEDAPSLPMIPDEAPAAGPVWIGGYGWIYPHVPYRYPCGYHFWRPHRWYPLHGCHPWRHGR
jgi:hypothetical protein